MLLPGSSPTLPTHVLATFHIFLNLSWSYMSTVIKKKLFLFISLGAPVFHGHELGEEGSPRSQMHWIEG